MKLEDIQHFALKYLTNAQKLQHNVHIIILQR